MMMCVWEHTHTSESSLSSLSSKYKDYMYTEIIEKVIIYI